MMAKKGIKYKDAMAELQKILEDMETERVDVDELSDKVQRAVELIRICSEKIEKTDFEIKKILGEFKEKIVSPPEDDLEENDEEARLF